MKVSSISTTSIAPIIGMIFLAMFMIGTSEIALAMKRINLFLLIVGCFIDNISSMLILTPIFLPICQSFGMSTIQFGLILVYNLCIGNITPPVGNALFVGIKVGRTSLAKVMPYMLMYYVAIIGGLLLGTFIPANDHLAPGLLLHKVRKILCALCGGVPGGLVVGIGQHKVRHGLRLRGTACQLQGRKAQPG